MLDYPENGKNLMIRTRALFTNNVTAAKELGIPSGIMYTRFQKARKDFPDGMATQKGTNIG